jgi:hypothetical protein
LRHVRQVISRFNTRSKVDFPPPAGPKSTLIEFAGISRLIFLSDSFPSE